MMVVRNANITELKYAAVILAKKIIEIPVNVIFFLKALKVVTYMIHD